MRRSLRAAGLGRHESGPSSSDHQDPVSPPIAPPSWVPDPPPMDPGQCIIIACYLGCFQINNDKNIHLNYFLSAVELQLHHIPVKKLIPSLLWPQWSPPSFSKHNVSFYYMKTHIPVQNPN